MDKATIDFYSGLLSGCAYLAYIFEILFRGGRPVRASWIIWFTLDVLALSAMRSLGQDNSLAWVVVFGSGITLALSFWRCKPGWSITDKLCLGLCIPGIIVWLLVGRNAQFATTVVIGVNLISMIPTWVSTWEDSRRESRLAWLSGFIAFIGSMHAFQTWEYVEIGQTCTFAFMNGTEILLLYFLPTPPKESFDLHSRIGFRIISVWNPVLSKSSRPLPAG